MPALVWPINTDRLVVDCTATLSVVPTYLSAGPENKSVLQIEAVVVDISDGAGFFDIHSPANNILFCDRRWMRDYCTVINSAVCVSMTLTVGMYWSLVVIDPPPVSFS